MPTLIALAVFRELFYETLQRCQLAAPRKLKKFRFKNKLLSLGSSLS